MRNRPANWVIAALLLQLAVGLQWQVAHAVAALPEPQKNAMEAGHCPGHQSNDSRTVEKGGAGASTGAPSLHDNPGNKHDCCRSVGCQCHYAQNPGVLDLPGAGAVFSTLLLQSGCGARPPVARTNTLFRPPIAQVSCDRRALQGASTDAASVTASGYEAH